MLVYITLDLSLASMPGAFVFEASESVETIKASRVRAAADVFTGARDVRACFTRVIPDHACPLGSIPRDDRVGAVRPWAFLEADRSRTADPPPSSEEPH